MRKNKGFFITGTDTGVGKTYVASGLISAMIKKGLTVSPFKPVESGCRMRKGELIPSDTVSLMKVSHIQESINTINPYRLKHALAPSVAAEIENVRINKKTILSAFKRLADRYDITIVEGAGGLMVPVYRKYLVIDIAKDLNLPIIIVSRPGLGTINHTLLTIEAAQQRGLHVLGVIINYAEPAKKGLSEKTNPEVIERLSRIPVLAVIPFSKNTEKGGTEGIFKGIVEKLIKREHLSGAN